jgi:excinuclease ABC subunit C
MASQHAAAEALEAIGMIDQPLASIAKREEIIYVYGQEDEPFALDRFSPILHLVQSIRDEAHRFAVTFHRSRRNARQLTSELDAIPGVGKLTTRKLLKQFGSSELVREASEDSLAAVVGRAAARKVRAHCHPADAARSQPDALCRRYEPQESRRGYDYQARSRPSRTAGRPEAQAISTQFERW